jgi:hypothetical protein
MRCQWRLRFQRIRKRAGSLARAALPAVGPVVRRALAQLGRIGSWRLEIDHMADLGVARDPEAASAGALPREAVSRDGSEAGRGMFGRRRAFGRWVLDTGLHRSFLRRGERAMHSGPLWGR